MIADLKNTEKVLAGISRDGWNLQEPLKWSFFFYDEERAPLNRIFDELSDGGYCFESLSESDDDEWVLHVSRVEILSAEKLHARNLSLNELAEQCNVQRYDCWDVEQVKSE